LAALSGPGAIANARAYLDLLAAAESGLPEETFSRAGFNLPEAFQPPDPGALDARVELLTVHGAKGLEFHQVFLPFLDWQPLKNESKTPPFLLEEIPGSRLHGLALARPYLQEKQSSLYVLLRRLKERRILEEARRVFYVAVTRARRGLVLSAVIKPNKNGDFTPPGDSPLGWLWQHYQPSTPIPAIPTAWPEPETLVELVTAAPVFVTRPREALELPTPWDFQPEPRPYQLEFPSQLAEKTQEPAIAAGSGDDTPRGRGEVTHRLLETITKGGAFPPPQAVAAALRQGGVAPETAARLAPEILAEVAACRRDPFLAGLLAGSTPPRNEWLLEAAAGPGCIRRGVIDLLAFDGQSWWLVDYKTSRPEREEDWQEFIKQEMEKYRPQLLAYQEMAAGLQGLTPENIRLVLYFTGCQRAVMLSIE